jgi:hypothetical protein
VFDHGQNMVVVLTNLLPGCVSVEQRFEVAVLAAKHVAADLRTLAGSMCQLVFVQLKTIYNKK